MPILRMNSLTIFVLKVRLIASRVILATKVSRRQKNVYHTRQLSLALQIISTEKLLRTRPMRYSELTNSSTTRAQSFTKKWDEWNRDGPTGLSTSKKSKNTKRVTSVASISEAIPTSALAQNCAKRSELQARKPAQVFTSPTLGNCTCFTWLLTRAKTR